MKNPLNFKGVVKTKDDLPKEGAYELKNPPTMAASEYKDIICWVTKEVAGMRVVVYKRIVSSQAMFWYWKGGAYYLDTSWVRLFDKKPILVYDLKYTEPMEVVFGNAGESKSIDAHMPRVLIDEHVHFAPDADMILKGQIVMQAVGGTKPRITVTDKEKFVWLIVGVVAGAAIGYLAAKAFAGYGGGLEIMPLIRGLMN